MVIIFKFSFEWFLFHARFKEFLLLLDVAWVNKALLLLLLLGNM